MSSSTIMSQIKKKATPTDLRSLCWQTFLFPSVETGLFIINLVVSTRLFLRTSWFSKLIWCSSLAPQLWIQSSSNLYKPWTLHKHFYWGIMESACINLCQWLSSLNVLFNSAKNRPGKKQTFRYWQYQGLEIPLTHARRADQSWNVTPTSWVQQEGGKYSWHTNRKWLEPPHNGASCTSPSPPRDSSLHT